MKKKGKEIGNRFAVFEVNEANTSKMSSCCLGHETRKWVSPITGAEVNGILVCQGCNKLLARDGNGSINIFHVAMAILLGQPRPFHLQQQQNGL